MKSKITISRICSSDSKVHNNVQIIVENDKCDRLFKVEVEPEKLALALTGLVSQDCDITLYAESVSDMLK